MDSQRDKASIVNDALIQHLGMPGTYSIDDETNIGGIVDSVWSGCVAYCFSLTDWSFCRRTARLVREDATPENGYQYGFALPGDRLGDALKFLDDPNSERPVRDFTIEGETVYTNVSQLWARCKVKVDPSAWDDAFTAAFTIVLASRLAVPVKQDMGLRSELHKQAFGDQPDAMSGGVFGRLIAQHGAAQPAASPHYQNDDPLTSAHTSGAWYGRW